MMMLHPSLGPFFPFSGCEGKRRQLKATGWKFGSAKEFLALSDQEAEYIELKLSLAESLQAKRHQRRLGQTDLAKLVKSSQSRVAKMEAADHSVSIDLLIRSLLALGTSNLELGRIITRSRSTASGLWTALRALPRQAQKNFLERLIDDPVLSEDLTDLALLERRHSERSRPFAAYVADRPSKK